MTLSVGKYADVYGTGSASTSVTATTINLSTSATTQTAASTPAPGTYTVHVTGSIVQIKGASEFQIQGGPGIGYLNVYTTGTTVKNYGGATLAAGQTAEIWGSGSVSTSVTASQINLTTATGGGATPTPAPPAPANVPAHVLTAALIYGYAGTPTTISPASMAPYVSWAQTDPTHASALHAVGIKLDIYMNFWKNYTTDNPNVGYVDLEPGGAHASAEAKTCAGAVIKETIYGGGYVANAMNASAAAHAQVVANYREGEYSNYDALFSDDTGALDGDPLPCGYSDAAYKAGTNAVDTSLGKPMFVNTLNAGNVIGQVGYTAAANVLGGMCESCLSYWAYNAAHQKFDAVRQTAKWTVEEDTEAQMVANHKIFWAYARAIGDASAETSLRMYTYASFLLTYDPKYAMLQEVLKTPSGFEVFPETGLVPLQPVTTAATSAGYQRAGGAYMREFNACYYRGQAKGKCAVVINTSYTAAAPVPTTAYHHAMTLSGYGVLDGGTASFTAAAPATLATGTAAILFQ